MPGDINIDMSMLSPSASLTEVPAPVAVAPSDIEFDDSSVSHTPSNGASTPNVITLDAKGNPTGLKKSDPFQFGNRFLNNDDDVWDHNAWDHVETDEEYKKYMEEQIEKQRSKPVGEFDRST